jgi:hypothetical protein
MSKLGPFLYFLALEDGPMHRRRIEAERAAMYRRPDAEPDPVPLDLGPRRGLHLPALLVRRRANTASD